MAGRSLLGWCCYALIMTIHYSTRVLEAVVDVWRDTMEIAWPRPDDGQLKARAELPSEPAIRGPMFARVQAFRARRLARTADGFDRFRPSLAAAA